VDERLAYAAAPLDDSGDWVSVSGSWGWQPRVVGAWRPFSSGWWVHTPAGLSWVSNEPWGWVTTHYGVWDYVPGYGWMWFPGSYYSPAWVYWYWGPTHVAWVPAGYYSRFYGPSYGRFGFDFHFGVYGWAGGTWDTFGHWTFCPVRYFGRRGYGAYWRSGVEVGRFERYRAVPRGVIATDTRAVHPGHWGKPQETLAALTRSAQYTRPGRSELADVTDFVARRPSLADDTRAAILRVKGPSGSATPEVRGGSSATSRLATSPWRTDPGRLPASLSDDADSRVSSIFASSQRDPAVARGARIEAYRRPTSAGGGSIAQPGAIPSSGPRLGTSSPRYYVHPGSESGRGGSGRIESGGDLGSVPSVRALPPSARGGSAGGSGLRYYDGGVGGDSRSPVIRQLIERMRSQEAAPQAAPPSRSGSSGAASSPSSGSGSRGSISSGSSGSSRGGSVSSSPSSSGGSSKSSATSSRSSGSSRTSNAQPRKPPGR